MLTTFTAEFEMPVWRVIPFFDAECVAIELRDPGLLQAKFAAVDLKTGEIILKPRAVSELWWVGLQGAAHGQLYLQQFHQQPQAGVSGIEALSLATGKESWTQKDIAFRGLAARHLQVQPATDHEAEIISIDPFSGNKIATNLLKDENGTTEQKDPEFPVSYSSGSPHYSTLQQFVQLKLHLDVQGHMEYLETSRHILFSIHIQEEEGLANYLVIFANNGHLRFRKKLTGKLTGFAADTFFVFAEKVVCVQDNKKLLIIDLLN